MPATVSTTAASSSRSSRRAAPTSGSIRPTRCTARSPTNLNVSDPTLGFVFTPGPQTGANDLTLPDRRPRDAVDARSGTCRSSAIMPWNSTLKITYQGNHNDKRLKYALGNLPLSPLDGPVTVVDHPFNAPGGRVPGPARQGHQCDRRRLRCAGTGLPGITTNAACPVSVPIADNEISLRVPRTNERRPNPLYTTNLLISNDAEAWYDGVEFTWDKRFSHGAAVPGRLHLQQFGRHDLRGDIRRRRRQQPAGTEHRLLAREVAVPHSASIHAQRQLPASVLRGPARALSDRRSAAGWCRVS